MIPKRLSLILSGLLVVLLVGLVLAAVSVPALTAGADGVNAAAAAAATVAAGDVVTVGSSSVDIKPSHPTPMAKMVVDPSYTLSSSSPSFQPTSEAPESPEEEATESLGEEGLGDPKEGAAVSGWPSSLEVEIEEMEIGGLAIPIVKVLTQNYKIETVNFGNVDAVSPSEGGVGVGAEVGAGQSGSVPGPTPVAA